MRITPSRLKQIIQEEVSAYALQEKLSKKIRLKLNKLKDKDEKTKKDEKEIENLEHK